MAKPRQPKDTAPGDTYDGQWGNVHETDLDPCPPDNLYPTYEQHGGDSTPQDNNANGSGR